MTVQDFIRAYNCTFSYVEERYGPDALKSLWKAISDQWCRHLEALIREKGLEGMQEYWGGSGGTLSREKAAYETKLDDDVFTIDMYECPSVAEIIERGDVPHHGALSYCDHCPALYSPIAEAHGFQMDFEIDYNDDGTCRGSCRMIARKKADAGSVLHEQRPGCQK